MANRYLVTRNDDKLHIKQYFTFPDRPNAERVNNFHIYCGDDADGEFVHFIVENGKDMVTGQEKKCHFRMNLETIDVLKKWLTQQES